MASPDPQAPWDRRNERNNGTNGTITPLSAKQGVTALPTGAPPTTVVELGVPAGNYVVFAKSELSQTGAGDSVECLLKSGATTIDQGGMKTLPALAAVPVSLQGVISRPDAHSVDPSVQRGRSQRVGQLQQPDRDPDRLSGPPADIGDP